LSLSCVRPKVLLQCCAATLLACAAAALIATTPAGADSGGTAVPDPALPATTATVPGEKARIVNGLAVPPESAPPRVQAVIAAANRISKRPYVWGGGHGAWESSGYDCSGAVSYALHGGRFLGSSRDSSGLERWGQRGRGSWITVYANRGHAFAVIAGLRWDTSGNRPGISGPRWHKSTRAATSGWYAVRHPSGY
jgi:hypothetical protein